MKNIEQTKQNLVETFPEHELIKKQDVAPILDGVFSELKTYKEIYSYVMEKLVLLYPEPNGWRNEEKYPDYCKWSAYFKGTYDKEHRYKRSEFNFWLENLENVFIETFGKKRTFKEACELAAKKWCEMIFGRHIQDNGDYSSTGAATSYLGTRVADMYKKDITEDVVKKAEALIEEYYENGCIYIHGEGANQWKSKVEPYSDYGPNTPLHDLLVKAGVEEKSTDCICPWKTGIYIDERDNTVVLTGYQKETYL